MCYFATMFRMKWIGPVIKYDLKWWNELLVSSQKLLSEQLYRQSIIYIT